MRRFSSEGSLLDLDFLPWRKMALRDQDHKRKRESYTPHLEEDELNGRVGRVTPTILEPGANGGEEVKRELKKELSMSVEELSELRKMDQNHLRVSGISEGCRAYSDGQLAPDPKGSTESMGRDDLPPPSPSSSFSNPFKSQQRHHRPKLSAAKLHLKSLFGQSPHSSNSNLFNPEHKDSPVERRSRLLFMRQWSQVGHGKKRKISTEELEKWAESLNALLACQTGVSVFGAFLRSEFSEENLQFYLACEQYKHSSNNFSLQRRAKDISSTYIQPGAPREVNLDSKTRDLTLQLLKAPSHTSLNHAQKRIYSLLDTDCYPRFLQSTIYLSLLHQED
ncbi:regulator of G-protein signaling 8 [Notolabrus celidotus]|uniref:regulator of G-protein signaling 8 n=1 Tax=Notolabrus celidotus TaxID=1203425 RepID=UPI00148FE757|nr:regulator of G-protein signaling 8 [Notolabrus celidotus]XP_034560665.1 regulator of G-protein signaling 8 [Notolabrus celidotus]